VGPVAETSLFPYILAISTCFGVIITLYIYIQWQEHAAYHPLDPPPEVEIIRVEHVKVEHKEEDEDTINYKI